MNHHIHTITADDVGKLTVRLPACPSCGRSRTISLLCLGRVIPIDIGKRVYDVDGVIQVENQEQLNRRLDESVAPVKRCGHAGCRVPSSRLDRTGLPTCGNHLTDRPFDPANGRYID